MSELTKDIVAGVALRVLIIAALLCLLVHAAYSQAPPKKPYVIVEDQIIYRQDRANLDSTTLTGETITIDSIHYQVFEDSRGDDYIVYFTKLDTPQRLFIGEPTTSTARVWRRKKLITLISNKAGYPIRR